MPPFNYITAPICHGTNSAPPNPNASLLVSSPDAIRRNNSKISRPFASKDTPSVMISPQLMSISSAMRSYISVLVASLMQGVGL